MRRERPEMTVVDLLKEWNLGPEYLRAWADVAASEFTASGSVAPRGSVIPLVRLLHNMADIAEGSAT